MMFTEPLAAKIVKGEKTATRRVMKDNPASPWFKGGCKYEVGQVFKVNPGRGVLHVAQAEATAIYQQAPEEIKKAQAKEEGFPSVTAFLDAFTTINRGVNLSRPVWVVEFKLVGPTCLGCDGCGWCEGSPAWTCTDCHGTGIVPSERAKALVARVEEDERAATE